MRKLIKLFYNQLYKHRQPEMVKWWKETEYCRAKVTQSEDGSYVMFLEGEKYPFPGFPRGHLLYGNLSPLKHQIKNQIFNEAWRRLEDGDKEQDIINDIKGPILDRILEIGDGAKLDMLPLEKMCPAVREIHRAWTIASKHTSQEVKMNKLRDVLCFILQEDDGYRFRVQWLTNYFPKRNPKKFFDIALKMMEHAEVVGDMKERIRLLRRVLNLVLTDKTIGTLFDIFVKEVDWKKVKLSKADKYYFRAKHFKVDHPVYDY